MSKEPSRKSLQLLLLEGGRPSRILLERDLPTGERALVALKRGEDLPSFVGDQDFEVLVQDLEMGEGDEEAVKVIRGSGHDADLVIVAATSGELGEGGLDLDSERYEYLTRPLSPAEIQRLLEGEKPETGGGTPPRETSDRYVAPGILGVSQSMRDLIERARRVAEGSASVLILGETGTGKSLIARTIHESSPRRNKPFVVVNCAALTDQLLESELFGHEKGSFTGATKSKPGLFEVADGGTLFLDEVGEMSAAMQAKLLTVLDTGELRRVGGTRIRKVDTRIVAATNKDLDEEVQEDRFREDLLFRLNVVTLTVPPLRERPEDLKVLVEYFLERFRPSGRPSLEVSPGAMRLLLQHAWPGNVREVANTLEGLVLLAPGPVIREDDLPPAIRPAILREPEEDEPPPPMTEIERQHIHRTLRYTEGKKAPAARLLGIDVKTLNNKIKLYDIELD
jgi:two-component system response regulator HydG